MESCPSVDNGRANWEPQAAAESRPEEQLNKKTPPAQTGPPTSALRNLRVDWATDAGWKPYNRVARHIFLYDRFGLVVTQSLRVSLSPVFLLFGLTAIGAFSQTQSGTAPTPPQPPASPT